MVPALFNIYKHTHTQTQSTLQSGTIYKHPYIIIKILTSLYSFHHRFASQKQTHTHTDHRHDFGDECKTRRRKKQESINDNKKKKKMKQRYPYGCWSNNKFCFFSNVNRLLACLFCFQIGTKQILYSSNYYHQISYWTKQKAIGIEQTGRRCL